MWTGSCQIPKNPTQKSEKSKAQNFKKLGAQTSHPNSTPKKSEDFFQKIAVQNIRARKIPKIPTFRVAVLRSKFRRFFPKHAHKKSGSCTYSAHTNHALRILTAHTHYARRILTAHTNRARRTLTTYTNHARRILTTHNQYPITATGSNKPSQPRTQHV